MPINGEFDCLMEENIYRNNAIFHDLLPTSLNLVWVSLDRDKEG